MIERLRLLLRADSATCIASGVATAVLARSLARDLGVHTTAAVHASVAVRAVGVFLVGYGVVLALLARAAPRTVEAAGRLTAVADAAWVLATIVLMSVNAFSSGGDIVMLVAALPVAALGAAKVAALRSGAPRLAPT